MKPISKLITKLKSYEPENENRAIGARWVTMSNALTRAGQGLTLAEKRIVMMAVSTLDSAKPVTRYADVSNKTRIQANEYAETFGLDANTAYEQLQAGGENLYKRSITFYEAAHKRKGKALQQTIVRMRWISTAKYQKGEGWIELSWNQDLMPYLTNIKKQFTSYQLKQATALRSIYSWRLLELLTRFESTGIADYTVEDFAVAMDATEKQKSDFAALRRKIIEPAIKELTDKDNWLIEWQPIKAGRKVVKLRFTFQRNPQQSLF
jgi:plasmid replication initiation protein